MLMTSSNFSGDNSHRSDETAHADHTKIEPSNLSFGSVARDSPEMRFYAIRALPYHLIRSGQLDRAETVLTDLEFIEAKCCSGMTYELVDDYNSIFSSLPDQRHDGVLCSTVPSPGWLVESVNAVLAARPDP